MRLPGRSALRQDLFRNHQVQLPCGNVDVDTVAVAYQGDRPAGMSSGATWPMQGPRVAGKASMVITATDWFRPKPVSVAAVGKLAHPRPASRTFVPDHQHLARTYRAGQQVIGQILFTFEDSRGTGKPEHARRDPPLCFTTAPPGARLPYSTANPPCGARG